MECITFAAKLFSAPFKPAGQVTQQRVNRTRMSPSQADKLDFLGFDWSSAGAPVKKAAAKKAAPKKAAPKKAAPKKAAPKKAVKKAAAPKKVAKKITKKTVKKAVPRPRENIVS